MNRNDKDTDWTGLSISFIIIAGVLVVFAFLAPMIFTQPSDRWDFTETGQIGDTIGGIINPFIALVAVIMTFLAFYMQLRANKLQRDQFFKSQNNKNVDEKIDCYYKMHLMKNDIERVVSDVDRRMSIIDEFKQAQTENPYQLNKVLRTPLNQYDRLTNMDRLSIYKGFKNFLSSTPDWLGKFNNLYSSIDYIPDAFKQIYGVIDFHNKDVFDDKMDIRNDLIDLEKLGENFINANEGRNTPQNEVVRSMLSQYRGEIERSREAHEESNFIEIIRILQQFTDNVVICFRDHGYNPQLTIIADKASMALIKLNFIQQKSDHLNLELDAFISAMTGNDSIRVKLDEINRLIRSNVNEDLLTRLKEEYNSLPEN